MTITRLNHAVLYVRDLEATRTFYEEVLGFSAVAVMPGQAAFFRADGSTNDHDLGVFQIGSAAGASTAGRGTVGLYHLAWEVDTLATLQAMRERLTRAGALVGASDHSTTKSLYGRDPDGIEFEVCWIVPRECLTAETEEQKLQILPLDLDAEIARYGADRLGGIGVSIPATT